MLSLIIPATISIAVGVAFAMTRTRALAWVMFLLTASIVGVAFAALTNYYLWLSRSNHGR